MSRFPRSDRGHRPDGGPRFDRRPERPSFERPSFERRPPVRISTEQRPIEEANQLGNVPTVVLKTSTLNPNLFRKRLRDIPLTVKPGDVVAVDLEDGSRLGYGVCNPFAEIAVRMLSFGMQLPDSAHWRQRLKQAVSLRTELLKVPATASAYRLVHGEGDGLPGLIIDRYDDVLSVEAFSLGMFQRAASAVEILGEICGTNHAVIRTSPHSEDQERFGSPPLASADCPTNVTIQEYGTRFRVHFDGGHKTGFFCDQRENRKKLAEFCAGKSMLDLCCYTGGFAVQAKVLGKAADVTAVEIDEAPLKLAKDNAKLNQAKINFVQSDVFPYMRDMLRNGKKYDVIVLDPPKLLSNREELEDAKRKHFDLNRLAMQLVNPGGVLLTCSCAGLLADEEFQRMICSAARQAGPEIVDETSLDARLRHAPRDMQIIAKTGAGPDHPILGNCPESEYLKAYWVRMW